jgi:hypothetical protein
MRLENRKVVQISVAIQSAEDYERTVVLALCNDGTMWEGERASGHPYWVQLPAVPRSEDDD